MSLSSFKNVINKMCLKSYIYILNIMYKEDLELNNL